MIHPSALLAIQSTDCWLLPVTISGTRAEMGLGTGSAPSSVPYRLSNSGYVLLHFGRGRDTRYSGRPSTRNYYAPWQFSCSCVSHHASAPCMYCTGYGHVFPLPRLFPARCHRHCMPTAYAVREQRSVSSRSIMSVRQCCRLSSHRLRQISTPNLQQSENPAPQRRRVPLA